MSNKPQITATDYTFDFSSIDGMLFIEREPTEYWRLRVSSHFTIEQPACPNAWFRFWHRVLLGWTWEKV